MKNLIQISFFVFICFAGYSQGNQLIQQFNENACRCIDSLSAYDKNQEEISKDIHGCISRQTRSYYLISELTKSADTKNISDTIKNVYINLDENSADFKKYYYELENSLMSNCKALKQLVAENNKIGMYSMSKDPKALELYYKAGAEMKKENYKKANQYYKEAVAVDSMFAFAWDNLGLSYRKLNDYPNALAAYKTSLRIDPHGSMPLHNIPIVYSYMKEYTKAVEAYEQLFAYDSNDPEAYYGLGQIYLFNLKDYEQSLECICKAYLLYISMKSPYRSDAEYCIRLLYSEMKKANQEELFRTIMKKYNIKWE